MKSSSSNFETIAIRTQADRSSNLEHSVPIYLTSSFLFEDAEDMRAKFTEEREGLIYSRYSNPNTDELIDKIAQMEGSEDAWATASGMAAVFTTFAALLQSGDHILSSRSVFGSTHQLFTKIFPKWGIKHTYVPVDDLSVWESEITPETKIIYAETPSNPALDILDLEFLGKLAKKHNLLLVIDNCFATPYLQKPLEWGADISIHSATKYIDGQGRCLGGLICANSSIIKRIEGFARHSGPAMSPFHAHILSKSLETLALRMDRHCDNAHYIAEKLEGHPAIEKVNYPFLQSHPMVELAKKQMRKGGGIVTFHLKGGLEAGRRFLNQLKMISLTANLGDSRSIAIHPASTTHSKLTDEERSIVGITPGLVRLSVGLEHREDILDDVMQALNSL